MFENLGKYIWITKIVFYISSFFLVLSVVLSNFIEGTFFNAVYLLSFGVTAFIVTMVISLFFLYWVGWTYRRVIVYKSERKEQRISE